MITYRASDVKFSWDHGENYSSPWPRSCGYVKEGADEEAEDDDDEDEHGVREKRQSEPYEHTPTKTRCPLLLVADYRFYQEMGASNTKTTINYLVGLESNLIFKR